MARRRFLIGWIVLVLLPLPAAYAAEVAVLKSVDEPAWSVAVAALRRACPDHKVTAYDLHGDRAEGLRVLAGLKDKDAIVVALGPMAAELAREAAPELPLVFAMVAEPERIGLSPAPGLAGVAFRIPVRNQLAAFRFVNPRGVRIGVVHGPASAEAVAEAKQAARSVGLDVHARALASDDEVWPALRALFTGPEAVDALWLPADPLLLGADTRRFLLKEASRAGKPVYTFSANLVAEGALASNGPDFASIGQMAAELVNRLAAGERERIALLIPRAELTINTKTASKLKIDISAGALAAAGKIY